MIVNNIGYLKLEQVVEMFKNRQPFSIYKTHKNTSVLVKNAWFEERELYKPKEDRLPWKISEGKKIVKCKQRIFNSLTDDIDDINFSMENQIMSYEEFTT